MDTKEPKERRCHNLWVLHTWFEIISYSKCVFYLKGVVKVLQYCQDVVWKNLFFRFSLEMSGNVWILRCQVNFWQEMSGDLDTCCSKFIYILNTIESLIRIRDSVLNWILSVLNTQILSVYK